MPWPHQEGEPAPQTRRVPPERAPLPSGTPLPLRVALGARGGPACTGGSWNPGCWELPLTQSLLRTLHTKPHKARPERLVYTASSHKSTRVLDRRVGTPTCAVEMSAGECPPGHLQERCWARWLRRDALGLHTREKGSESSERVC